MEPKGDHVEVNRRGRNTPVVETLAFWTERCMDQLLFTSFKLEVIMDYIALTLALEGGLLLFCLIMFSVMGTRWFWGR